MTDPQFQPGQDDVQIQNNGVFGGDGSENTNEENYDFNLSSMFGTIDEEKENTVVQTDLEPIDQKKETNEQMTNEENIQIDSKFEESINEENNITTIDETINNDKEESDFNISNLNNSESNLEKNTNSSEEYKQTEELSIPTNEGINNESRIETSKNLENQGDSKNIGEIQDNRNVVIEEAIEDNIEEKNEIKDEIVENKETENIKIEGNKEFEDNTEIQEDDKFEDNLNNQEEIVENYQESKEKSDSDLQNKRENLLENIENLNDLLENKDGDIIEIIGANTDKFSILYQFLVNKDGDIRIKRIETKKDNSETNFNELKLGINSESNLLEIFLDEVLLFEESDLLEDNKQKSQVMDKLNKFIFLTESKLKDLEKEKRAREQEEQERKKLQDVFRNF